MRVILLIVMKFTARIVLLLAATLVFARPVLACCCSADLRPEAAASEPPSCHETADDHRSDPAQAALQACGDCADLKAAPAPGDSRAARTQERSHKISAAPAHILPPVADPLPVRITGPPPLPAPPGRTPVQLKQRLLI